MFCEKSVKTGSIYIYQKTRKQENRKGAKGIIKINFPI